MKRGNLQWFGNNHLAKKKIIDPHNFFCRAFLLPVRRVNVRGKFIPAEALRSRRLCIAARSLAAGVFAGKNDLKVICGVPGVDGRPIDKNTNNWKASMEYLALMEDRWAVRRKVWRRDVAKLARPPPVAARGLRASFPMASVNRLGIYANSSPLFAKLTKLQSPNAKPLDRCF